jgi:hypothetical protein
MNYGQHVKAYLVNNVAPAEPTAESHPELYAKIQETPMSATELAGLGRSEWFSKGGNGYFRQQATKPQTIGYQAGSGQCTSAVRTAPDKQAPADSAGRNSPLPSQRASPNSRIKYKHL